MDNMHVVKKTAIDVEKKPFVLWNNQFQYPYELGVEKVIAKLI